MINNLSILFSIVGVFFVVVRAALLDRTTPWFQIVSGPKQAPSRRRNPFGQ